MRHRVFLLLILSFPALCISSFHLQAIELRIFTEEMPPYNYLDEKTNQASGFSVEIVKALMTRSGLTIAEGAIKIYPWARAYKIVQEDKNVMLFTMTRSEPREQMFKWVGPVASRTIWLWKLKERKDIVVTSLSEAKQYKVGGVYEFASTKYLQELGFEVHRVNLIKQNWEKLFKHRIDQVSALELEAAHHMHKLGKSFLQLERLIKIDDRYDYYLALNKKTDDYIVDQLQGALDSMKQDGSYERIKQTYLK